MKLSNFLVLFAFCSIPALQAQIPTQDSNSTTPAVSDDSQRPQGSSQAAQDPRCGPGGCIVSNDQSTVPREAGAEGQERNPMVRRVPPPYGSTPDLDDARPTNKTQTSATDAIERDQQTMVKEPPTEFEKFVEDTTGHQLPVFGRRLFLNSPADFLPATSVSPPADYVIGSGDQLKVRAWGSVNVDVLSTVDRNGMIFIPQVGTVAVAGMHLDDVSKAVRSAVKGQFRGFEISVTLGQLRSIQIFVLGEARRPGVYTVSSLSTLVNALFTSGGPSSTGSLRDIQVTRGGKILTHFDVYDLLLHGDKSEDVHLQPGDIIFIPPVGPQVAIDGEVQRPGVYELRGQTMAQTALDLAGGLTPVASLERASVDRIEEHKKRVVEEFPLSGPQRLIPIQGGDLLRVFPIAARIDRAVTLQGNVGSPGRFPWREGMRITDLIPNRQFLLTRNYFNKQNALNPAPADRPFAISSENAARSNGSTTALSEEKVQAASTIGATQTDDETTELVSHDTEINWNYAMIERLGGQDLKTEIVPFALGEAIDHPASAENKLLEPGDVVVVYSRKDLNLPQELRARFIRVDGEVNRPGIYRIGENETLRDVVTRAGGVAPHGYLYASQLKRESVRIAQEAKLQALIKDESERALSPVNRTVSSDGKSDSSDLELRKAYIAALSKIHSTGRVVLQMSPQATTEADIPEFALQDGDHYFVPSRPNTVDVIGNVYNQGTMRYLQDSRAGVYLKAAGGHTREGDKLQEFILRADGTVLSRREVARFDKLLIFPGDTVIVPARLRPGFSMVELLAYTQLISSFALTAVAIRALQ